MLSSCNGAVQWQRGSTFTYADGVPTWIKRAWLATSDHLTSKIELPELHVLRDADGSGGFFLPAPEVDIVAVGLADVRDLTNQVMARLPKADATAILLAPYLGQKLVRWHEVRDQVAALLFAHELGHLIDLEDGRLDGTVAAELRADGWAGEFSEQAGLNPAIATAFFEVIGCTAGALCTHPDPRARVNAYLQGRARVIARRLIANRLVVRRPRRVATAGRL